MCSLTLNAQGLTFYFMWHIKVTFLLKKISSLTGILVPLVGRLFLILLPIMIQDLVEETDTTQLIARSE